MSKGRCIVCQRIHDDQTVEHIIPRTLGNIHYILPKEILCGKCNNRFAKVENHVLSSDLFWQERKQLGLLRRKSELDTHVLTETKTILFALKMAYEALHHSKNKMWNTLNHFMIRKTLIYAQETDHYRVTDWPENLEMRPIPDWIDRWRLRNSHLELSYAEGKAKIYFQFQFGKIRIRITLPMESI